MLSNPGNNEEEEIDKLSIDGKIKEEEEMLSKLCNKMDPTRNLH